MEGPGLQNVDVLYGHLEYFTGIWDILRPFYPFCVHLVHFFPVLVSRTKKKSGSPVGEGLQINKIIHLLISAWAQKLLNHDSRAPQCLRLRRRKKPLFEKPKKVHYQFLEQKTDDSFVFPAASRRRQDMNGKQVKDSCSSSSEKKRSQPFHPSSNFLPLVFSEPILPGQTLRRG
jgi:hypothetical protein